MLFRKSAIKARPETAPKRPRRAQAGGVLKYVPWIALGVMLSLWPRDAHGHGGGAAYAHELGRGRKARTPHEIPPVGWRDILWRTLMEFRDDKISLVAGSVAFAAIMALFPALAAFVALYGMFADVATARDHLSILAGFLPAEALTLIGREMVRIAEAKGAGLNITFVAGLLLSLWSSNAGMKALFAGLNIAYEEQERRSFLRVNLVTLGFTLGAVAFMTLASISVIALPIFLQFFRLDSLDATMALLRWPALYVMATLVLSVIYRFGPSREHARWRWVSVGGAVAAALWLGGSLLFSWYLSNFSSFNTTYGSLGAIFGLFTWIFLSCVIVLFGAELNAEIEHQTSVDSTTGAPRPLGMRGAVMADTIGRAKRGPAWDYLPAFVARWAGRRTSPKQTPPEVNGRPQKAG